MNSFKKIFTTIMLTTSLIVFAHDANRQEQEVQKRKREQEYAQQAQQSQKSAAIWAGVIGAVAGSAIGYWIGSSDATPEVKQQPCVVERIVISQQEVLSPRARHIQSQLDGLSKYGQNFNLYDDYRAGVATTDERNIIINLHKLGFRLDQIDSHFYNKLAQDNKALSDAGYAIWWYGIKNLEYQKDEYLANSHKIIAYFNRHQDFIKGCQVINFYDTLPLHAYDLVDWAKDKHVGQQYPLIAFKNKVESDKQQLAKLLQRYSGNSIADRACTTQRFMNQVLDVVYNSYAYQQEVDQKRQEELLAEYRHFEAEKLEIARREAYAREEANRLAAERNRIERERYQNYRNDRY